MKTILSNPLGCKKNLLFLVVGLCFSLQVFSQAPANDNCGGATVLTSGTSCTPTLGTLINATKSATPPGACGDNNSPDVWYRFQAQSTNPKIVLSNVGNNLMSASPRIQLLSGACASLTQITCQSGTLLNATGLTIGTFYYVRITTNLNFASPSSGSYTFNICIQDPLPNPLNFIDYSKSYINISDGTVGGTINQGDVLEIRATLVVKNGAGTITNVSFYDTLKRNAGFIFKDSIATRTNEGKNYKTFTNAIGDDAGWKAPTISLDTSIQINIGTGATSASGGSLTSTSRPSLFTTSACIIMATYRVTVDTGTVGYGRKINYGGGAFRYNIGVTQYTISFPRDSLIVYPTLTACSDAVSPGNLIGSASGGTFGSLTTGSSASGTQNAGPASINTTYLYETFNSGPNDYYYGIANNTSLTNSINQTLPKSDGARVFGVWDITGDHTGATNTAKGNKPCDASLPVSPTNPCGYMLAVNAAYRSDKVFEYAASGVCSETYYELSAWFKNLCYKCGCDSVGRGVGTAGYIPTAPGDSSGVRPNIAMQIDGIDYYTTGELVYQGLGSTQSASDTLNNWVRRSFVFKTGVGQTSFKVTFRNNAPGGGGNDWAVDDIGLRTCFPDMIYTPPNPIAYMGNPLTITCTVRSYFNSYTYYKWQRKPVSGAWTDIAGTSGSATPVYNPLYNQYEYSSSYTIPGTATLAGNAGDLYQMLVATTAANLGNGCVSPSSQAFTLLPTDGPCAFADTNYAVAPQTGYIDWNKLNWSLGHVPTCCESAQITYTSSKASADTITVNITNDICIINLTLLNKSTTANQIFKTVLYPGYNMQMNGNVRMGATASTSTDSCIFIAQGGGTITVNGNTVIGYPADNAYCIFGSAPGTGTYAKYRLRGDSLTFNNRAITNPNYTSITIDPLAPATPVKITNNTGSFVANQLTFDSLRIGTTTNPAKAILYGSNTVASVNDNFGGVDVQSGSEFDWPTNAINALGSKSSFYLRQNSTLKLGGSTNGMAGSNFPSNYINYTLDPTSTVIFYGASQSIPGTTNNVNTYGNITLSGTGVKTGSTSNVNLAGNLYRTNGGHTYAANGGRVTFTSSINNQRYYTDAGATPIDFYDFTNNNTHTSGLTIDSTIGILNELELKAATKTTLNTGDIIMRSSSTRTSHVTNLGTTIPAIIYNDPYRFVVERYLPGVKSWRFLATPLDTASSPTVAAAWRENASALTSSGYGTAITGPTGPNAQFDYYTQRGSMKYYNPTANVWTELLTNTTATKIANLPGYMVFVRGDRGAPNTTAGAGTPTNLRIKGKIRTGNQIFSVGANKFQSIGNPFASQINFGTLTTSNVTNSFIVWNPTLPGLYGVGGYENYSWVSPNYRLNGLAGGAIRNTIQSGEAFFVQNNSASAGTVTIKESDKGTGSATVSRGNTSDINYPTLDVSLFEKDPDDNFVMMDGASISFDSIFSSGLDNDDVIKFTNTNDNLFIKSNNTYLVVERRPTPTVADTVRLGMTGMRIADYRLRIEPHVFESVNLDAYLVDKYLQTETAINSFDTSLDFNFSVTSVAASSNAERFIIVFRPAAVLPVKFVDVTAVKQDTHVAVSWKTASEVNVDHYEVERSTDGTAFTKMNTTKANNTAASNYNWLDVNPATNYNYYRIKSVDADGKSLYSKVVKVLISKEQLIVVNPNPVVNNIINLQMPSANAGLYIVRLISNNGQVVYNGQMKHLANNAIEHIDLGKEITKGIYRLEIVAIDGVKTSITVSLL